MPLRWVCRFACGRAGAGPGVEVPLAVLEVRLMGGALGRPAQVTNAVAGRDGARESETAGAR